VENVFQWIPAVDELLENERIRQFQNLPRVLVVDSIRAVLAEHRRILRQTADKYPDPDHLREAIMKDVISRIRRSAQPVFRPVINGTGIVLHTNLGRAVLSQAAREAVDLATKGYSNLELNLDLGQRGSRYAHVEDLILKLTGAEACLVVNNNAAAVLLALDTLAKGKETIVSRGELVEIGGAFRVPEVMERSGSRLVEVGTTNKTYIGDYEREIRAETGLLLKVHTSNYRVVGFTHEPALRELVELGRKSHIPVMEDLGSGCLYDLKAAGVGDEPTVQQVVSAGADVVTFSGDKLLGGPQAGIIVGKEQYISPMKKNPLTRALRIDKMTVAALEATLRSYLDQDQACGEIPTLEMLTRPLGILAEQARKLGDMITQDLESDLDVHITEGVSQVGGGSLPTVELATWLVFIKPKAQKVDSFVSALRKGNPALLTYIREDWVVLDPRTIFPEQYEQLVEVLKKACGGR